MHYFILHSNLRVTLSQKEPPVHRWKAPVYLGESYSGPEKTLMLVSEFAMKPYIPPSPPQRFAIPLLKSNLQMAICRGAIDAAVGTAWQLVQQGPAGRHELLRELPILLLKEGFLNTHILPRLVWWLLATEKGWICSEDEYQRLLLDVATMTNVEFCIWRDIPPNTNASMDIQHILRVRDADQQVALFSIWIRALWGGFLGDVRMLRNIFHSWAFLRSAKDWSVAASDPTESCILLAPLESLRFDVRRDVL